MSSAQQASNSRSSDDEEANLDRELLEPRDENTDNVVEDLEEELQEQQKQVEISTPVKVAQHASETRNKSIGNSGLQFTKSNKRNHEHNNPNLSKLENDLTSANDIQAILSWVQYSENSDFLTMMIRKHQVSQTDSHSEIFEEAVKRLGDLLKMEKAKSTKLADVYNHREQELKKEMAR